MTKLIVTFRIFTNVTKNTLKILVGVTGEWRRLHNEELSGLYSSPNIVRVIKSRGGV